MILQALVNYYDSLALRGDIAEPGWSPEKVSFALNLSPNGELLHLVPLLEQAQRGKKTAEFPRVMVVTERAIRTVDIKANLLCDNTMYMMGFGDKGKPERILKCFEACKMLHLKALASTRSPAAEAIKSYFAHWDPSQAREHPAVAPYLDALATANVVFFVNGDFAQNDPEIRRAWQALREEGEAGVRQRCLVTGEIAPVAPLHNKIKGVSGAQSSGASLVSFNAPAYLSYGKEGDDESNAPVSSHAAFAYVTALNRLLSDREHRQLIGDTTVVYWSADANLAARAVFTGMIAPQPGDDTVLSSIMQNQAFFPPLVRIDARLEGVMQHIALLMPVDEAEVNIDLQQPFYVLGLAPNAARISVRFFLQGSFGGMVCHLCAHYRRLEIVRPSYDDRAFLSIYKLLDETVNQKSLDKAASPLLAGAVMRAVLMGDPYPQALMAAALGRIRAEQSITRGRAAILKACLLHNYHHTEEAITVALNESSDNRAYTLGRLFAVLESAQLQANPGINTTIKDRYFAAAGATPRNVFPKLLSLAAHHTAKAEYGYAREQEIGKLLDKLNINDDPFPAYQTQEEQGFFYLGYYQQAQARYIKKEDA